AVNKDFIPTNLRAGIGFTTKFNASNSLTFLADFNKLLVPTPPVYLRDSLGYPVYDDENNRVISKGMDPNVSVLRGMFQSWYDAPGGFEEEMKEWSFGIGAEYWFRSNFSARAGIYHEDKTKGTRRYFTTGIGIRFGYFGFDTGILIPFEENAFNAFNLRSSIMLDIGRRKK
ncbi:MAG: PorV/PorQ family protein, partial [Bacteroidales bacterium]